jgi:hypothetical protein
MRVAGFALSATTVSHGDNLSKPQHAREYGTLLAQPVGHALVSTGSFLVTFGKVFLKSNFKSQQRYDFKSFLSVVYRFNPCYVSENENRVDSILLSSHHRRHA